jgi:ParB-like chromosome segregation protein Spo0J
MAVLAPLEVRVLPVGELRPAAYNPRRVLKPTNAAYCKLRRSLEEFGLVEPLVWNELTGRVVGGHARLRILKELGVTEVPVSVVRLTEVRERALIVVLNNYEAQGRYDPAKLAELLTELDGLPELPLTGFEASALANLRYEPAGELPAAGGEPDRVEVTLVTDAATFGKMRERLDELVGAFDLEAHVRRG